MRDIGKNIKHLREENKLSQEQLAEKLFVTRQTISNYETGRSRPDVEMLKKIAEVLDTDVNTVIYGVQSTPEQWLERKTLVIAFLITLVLGITWFTLSPLAQAYQTRHFTLVPKLLLRITVLPSLLMMLGWTAMQSFHVFLGAKRLKGKNIPLIRGILLIALFLWVLFVIPPVVDLLRSEIIRWQWLQTHNSYNSADFALSGIWKSIVLNPLSSYLVFYHQEYFSVFSVVGIALWIVGFPKREHVTKT
ncbi:MAG: helix-turn-helix transcriptional regulator [Erysipelotrichaceae bacterium]|nr:helix-turn-helix transcriptional regulator [Erysipelotrichaceae bacterium]